MIARIPRSSGQAQGIYALRGIQEDAPGIAQEELARTESSEVTGLVNAFGMFWDRNKSELGLGTEDPRAAAGRIETREFRRAAG
jgi:hypothetical protein